MPLTVIDDPKSAGIKMPCLAVFRGDRATIERFNRLFMQSEFSQADYDSPFTGASGRILLSADCDIPNVAVRNLKFSVVAHNTGDDPGVCWISLPWVLNRNCHHGMVEGADRYESCPFTEAKTRGAAPEILEAVKQRALKIMIEGGVLEPSEAMKAGYNSNHPTFFEKAEGVAPAVVQRS